MLFKYISKYLEKSIDILSSIIEKKTHANGSHDS